jgi:hypothetical protein
LQEPAVWQAFSFPSEEFIRPHKIVRIAYASPRIPDFRAATSNTALPNPLFPAETILETAVSDCLSTSFAVAERGALQIPESFVLVPGSSHFF